VTDEWRAYSKLSEEGRPHATVNHARREWGYNRKRGDKEELWKMVSRVVDKELFSYVPG
jgi:hypothetical protein